MLTYMWRSHQKYHLHFVQSSPRILSKFTWSQPSLFFCFLSSYCLNRADLRLHTLACILEVARKAIVIIWDFYSKSNQKVGNDSYPNQNSSPLDRYSEYRIVTLDLINVSFVLIYPLPIIRILWLYFIKCIFYFFTSNVNIVFSVFFIQWVWC